MNNIKIFENPEFGSIRTVEVKNEPWFVGKDVAEVLGYSNTMKAIRDHVKDNHKLAERIVLSGQTREAILIDEAGVYSLVMRSKLPKAEQFQEWVTSEVLPAIRKTGGYINGSETMSDAEIMAKALMVAQKTIEANKERISKLEGDTERMKPKEIFADAVATSHTSILIGDLAKLLKQNGIETGQKRLFEWMRENGYLIKRKGSDWNMPTQKAMELGLFEVKESTVNNPDGSVRINRTTKVTGKGQQYFVNKFLDVREEKGA